MNVQPLFNELLVGQEGTDRKTLVPCTLEQATIVLRWFNGELEDMALVDMLAGHSILHCHPTATFERHWPEGHATPWIEMRIPEGEGYDIYVPMTIVGLEPQRGDLGHKLYRRS